MALIMNTNIDFMVFFSVLQSNSLVAVSALSSLTGNSRNFNSSCLKGVYNGQRIRICATVSLSVRLHIEQSTVGSITYLNPLCAIVQHLDVASRNCIIVLITVQAFRLALHRFYKIISLRGEIGLRRVFLMIFMIFFDNKGMNIIYLYFVNILYIYLRRNCEIFKFFF